MARRGRLVANHGLLPVDPDELRGERLACCRRQDCLDGPVLAGDEGTDLAFALDHQPHGDRLHPTSRKPRTNLSPEKRAEGVAHEAVDDAAGLLCIDKVAIDRARMRKCLANGRLRDLRERHTAGLRLRDVRGLGHVPGDGLALAVEVGGEVHEIGLAGGLPYRAHVSAPIVDDLVIGPKIVLDIHTELVLAGVLGQVADVAVRGQDGEVPAQISLDRLGLCGRLDDHKVAAHRAGV